MATRRPGHLNKAPIISSLFEVRYSGVPHTADYLPGILRGGLDDERIYFNPGPPIPPEAVKLDPALQQLPSFSLEYKTEHGMFQIAANDFFFSISFKSPYPGWTNLKEVIAKVIKIVCDSRLINTIDRYSIRCQDFIEATCPSVIDMLDVNISMGKTTITNQPLYISAELQESDFIHILSVTSPVTLNKSPGQSSFGLLVDTDTIRHLNPSLSPEKFLDCLDEAMENIHSANADKFFELIPDNTLEKLEPVYE